MSDAEKKDGSRSIGEILDDLRGDFPDISVSKIRFLESQGLITPERSPSGYRQFTESDLELLRWILRQEPRHHIDASQKLPLLLQEAGNAALAQEAGFDHRAEHEVAALVFADLVIGVPRLHELGE